ncbi:MAG TPA: thioredoxin family protein [Burkholderiaceae bacterium]
MNPDDDPRDARAAATPAVAERPAPPLLLACLCAQWCGTCRDYAPLLAGLGRGALGPQLHTRWIDIEDEAELVDGIDVENFPTLLIARGERVLFYGTVLPHAATLQRLAETALANELALPSFDDDDTAAAVHALARRLAREAGAATSADA